MENLSSKHAVVTGASYGIGPEIVRTLAAQGMKITLAARSAEKLQQVADRLQAESCTVIAVPADVTDPLGREALITQAEAELGPIDILVNCAGSFNAGRLHVRTEADLTQDIQTNLIAAIMLTRRLLPGMRRRREGRIVHITSLAGKVGFPYTAVYAASKYGLIGFNHCLQGELKGSGVQSTAVVQGFVKEKGMWARLQRKVHPAFGLSTPEDVARGVMQAIRGNKVEIIVNPLPVRPVILLWAVVPRLAGGLFRLLRVDDFAEGVGLQMEADATMAGAEPLKKSASGQ